MKMTTLFKTLLPALTIFFFSCSKDNDSNNNPNNNCNGNVSNSLAINKYVIKNDSAEETFTVSTSEWISDNAANNNMFIFIDESKEPTASNRTISFTFSGAALPETGTYEFTDIFASGGAEPVTPGKVQIMGVGMSGIASIGSGCISVINDAGFITIKSTDLSMKTFSASPRSVSLNLHR
jgi:hypothetical protein